MKRSLLAHLQMVSIVMSLNVAWPMVVRDVLVFISSLTSVAGHTASVQCSVKDISAAEIFYVALIVSSLLPFCAMVLMYPYWFVLVPTHKCYSCGRELSSTPFCPKRNPFSSEEASDHRPHLSDAMSPEYTSLHLIRDGWIISNLLLIYILYPSIVKMSFQMLQAQKICHRKMWAMDDTVEYGVGMHGMIIAVVAVPALILYGLIFPCLGMLYIRTKKDRQTNAKVLFRFGLLYSGYAPKFWWWELIIFVRKLTIILIVTFGSSYGQQLHMAMGVLFVLLYLQEHARPYTSAGDDNSAKQTRENDRLHLMESSSLLILILMVWSAVFFEVSDQVEKDFWCSLLSVLVIAFNVIYAFACAFVVLRAFVERNKLDIKLSRLASTIRRSSFRSKQTGNAKDDYTTSAEE